jgi:2-methylcitrate dehydratase PrpD
MEEVKNIGLWLGNKLASITRRGFFKQGGLALAGATLTRRAVARPIIQPRLENSVPSVMSELSAYMSDARSRALPEDIAEKVKEHILDTFAAMISGSDLLPGRSAINFAQGHGGPPVATVAASRVVCGPIEAALTNGMLAHSDETDDSHAPSQSHPGSSVVPAALAAGEFFGINGRHFLQAVALGYDVGTRMTMSLGGSMFESKHHNSTHSFAGNFGSAAAAGCAAGLDAQQMRWLLDYSAQQCSGITAWQRDTEHIEKSFVFAGMPARNGVTAALLVQLGWTGVDDILSGPDNFFLAYNDQADPAKLIDKLGERYEVSRTNIKKWTVGSPIQAPLDALEILMKQHSFDANQVQEVVVRVGTHESVAVNNRDMPDVCLQHMIAVMLADKTVSFRSAHDKARMSDPAIVRQRSKVRLIADAELERHLPRREAIVEVTLTDGSHFSQFVGAVRGTTDNPMTREEVVEKCRDLMAPIIGAAACTSLTEKVLTLEGLDNIRELRPLLQRN